MRLKEVLNVVVCQIVIYDRKNHETVSIGKNDRFNTIPFENRKVVFMDTRAVLNSSESSGLGFHLFTPYLRIEVE